MSIYTDDVRKQIDALTNPVPGFTLDILEGFASTDDSEPYILLQWYGSQWLDYNDEQKTKIAKYVIDIRAILTAAGIKSTYWIVEGAPDGGSTV